MINSQMKTYNYFLYGNKDEYGQQKLSDEPNGTIKMSINITAQGTQDNILYKDSSYIGLTHSPINDSYVIEYGARYLKVLYVNTIGRYTQVFMKEM